MSDGQSPMTDAEIAEQLAAHRAVVEALEALEQARARTSSAPALSPGRQICPPAAARKQPIAKRRWEPAARAFRRFPFEPHTIRRICANHPDWAMKLAGTWHVDLDPFNEFADKVDRGEASFDSSEKFASSVANSPQSNEYEHVTNSIDDEGDT